MRRTLAVGLLGLLVGCTLPQSVRDLDSETPPEELGRNGWVRYSARTGAWLGGVVGAVTSLATLPLTYPLSLLSDEPLGMSRREFIWFPVTVGASTGHFVIGGPVDAVDWMFYRAWTEEERPTDYENTPAHPPMSGRETRVADPAPPADDESGS